MDWLFRRWCLGSTQGRWWFCQNPSQQLSPCKYRSHHLRRPATTFDEDCALADCCPLRYGQSCVSWPSPGCRSIFPGAGRERPRWARVWAWSGSRSDPWSARRGPPRPGRKGHNKTFENFVDYFLRYIYVNWIKYITYVLIHYYIFLLCKSEVGWFPGVLGSIFTLKTVQCAKSSRWVWLCIITTVTGEDAVFSSLGVGNQPRVDKAFLRQNQVSYYNKLFYSMFHYRTKSSPKKTHSPDDKSGMSKKDSERFERTKKWEKIQEEVESIGSTHYS